MLFVSVCDKIYNKKTFFLKYCYKNATELEPRARYFSIHGRSKESASGCWSIFTLTRNTLEGFATIKAERVEETTLIICYQSEKNKKKNILEKASGIEIEELKSMLFFDETLVEMCRELSNTVGGFRR